MTLTNDKLLIMPLGGLEQIGGNSMLVGLNDEWIMIDLGISFHNKFGIEILTPDIAFAVSLEERLKGLFVTHAHEDHIGAIPYLWPQLKCPIYLTDFPAAVLKQKISEHDWKDKIQVNVVEPKQKILAGSCFEIEFVSLAHSILGACGIFIKTSHGNIFHTGDWKVDKLSLIGDQTDEKRLAEIGEEGVDCLLCDSTNILTTKNIGSESDVQNGLTRVISQHSDKRITVTCFASNLVRINTIFQLAKSCGRKIALIGRSMHNMIDAITKTSYYTDAFKAGMDLIVDDEKAASMPLSQVLILCTGSQGETRAALSKLSRGENKGLKLGKGDAVLFSSKVIPGNELEIREVQNQLVKKGVLVITTETEKDIHVSGHPNKEALNMMYGWLKPKTFIPIHGDARMLYAHRDFAIEKGIKETLIAESGDVICLCAGTLRKIDHKEVTLNAIDGYEMIPIGEQSIKDRANMAYNGHISISFVFNKDDANIVPDIVFDGIYIAKNNIKKFEKMISQIVNNEAALNANNLHNMKKALSAALGKLMFKHFKKKPTIAVHIHDSPKKVQKHEQKTKTAKNNSYL